VAKNCNPKSTKADFLTSRTGTEPRARLRAHYALRAAAQGHSSGSRFIKVPHAALARDAGIQTLLVQWTDSIADIEVVRVPVDFLAETAQGQLIVEIVIPGLPPRVPLERVEKLEVPALVVSLPDPALIKGWAALRQCRASLRLRTRSGLSLWREQCDVRRRGRARHRTLQLWSMSRPTGRLRHGRHRSILLTTPSTGS